MCIGAVQLSVTRGIVTHSPFLGLIRSSTSTLGQTSGVVLTYWYLSTLSLYPNNFDTFRYERYLPIGVYASLKKYVFIKISLFSCISYLKVI